MAKTLIAVIFSSMLAGCVTPGGPDDPGFNDRLNAVMVYRAMQPAPAWTHPTTTTTYQRISPDMWVAYEH